MAVGRVVRFDEVKGYGFIAPEEGGEDVFVHANDLMEGKQAITPGTRVEFQIKEGERGLKGYDVRVVASERRPLAAPVATADTEEYDEDATCDVLSAAALRAEVTEAFIQAAPDLTAGQIVRLRDQVIRIATRHGWTEG
ncbi:MULTISPECIES: cold-shock protein [unclassified Micromonospora]|uniref:cold-shock protein n=1 Tax=unclassified Micromonospora TaxID=2617518 RepID=UPI001033764D|nr:MULTISPECIES: cold shock domain-containing protein [unclassified Micromonospora]QKW15031.1 cold shock domain-containing protein [Verrucosispora sp. NA02020]TBL30508.1 cold shock domain-containing protein [Verrucosispora sp. SN26_14.1]